VEAFGGTGVAAAAAAAAAVAAVVAAVVAAAEVEAAVVVATDITAHLGGTASTARSGAAGRCRVPDQRSLC
jgi:hypothetical protein